jgi:hypothetical protein
LIEFNTQWHWIEFSYSSYLFSMDSKTKSGVLAQWAQSKKLKTAGPLFWAVVVQLALLLITIFVVVIVPPMRQNPEFRAHKTIYLPQKELEHKVAQAAFEQVASPPMIMDRIQSHSMADHALPDLPALPDAAFNPMVTPDMMAPSSAMFGSSGMAGLAGELGGESSSISFFGIKDQGQRVVVAFDVSRSVLLKAKKAGVSINKIKEETKKLIDELGPNTSFGVVQFVRRYDVFKERLVTGTSGNKERAKQWVDDEFNTTGNSLPSWQRIEKGGEPKLDGIQAVMQTIFAWEPDVIFIISDAGFGRNFPTRMMRIELDELSRDVSKLQRSLPEKARIHFIGFEVKEDRASGMKKIVRRSGGRFREF